MIQTTFHVRSSLHPSRYLTFGCCLCNMCRVHGAKSQIFFLVFGIRTGVSPLPCIYLSLRVLHGIIGGFYQLWLKRNISTMSCFVSFFFFFLCKPVTEKVQSAAKSTFSKTQSLLRKVHNARIRSCNFKRATVPLTPSWSRDVIKLTY